MENYVRNGMREARANGQAYEAEASERLRAISYDLTGLARTALPRRGVKTLPGRAPTDGGCSTEILSAGWEDGLDHGRNL